MKKTITFILGREVEDKITGFKGIVSAETFYTNGCHRVFVQGKVIKDNEKPDEEVFDRVDLIVKREVKPPSDKPNHGPRDNEKKLTKR